MRNMKHQISSAAMYALTCVLAASAIIIVPGVLHARVIEQKQKQGQWRTLTAQDTESGATIPPRINVVIHVPETVDTIGRETLFGNRGTFVRYWGYCFSEN